METDQSHDLRTIIRLVDRVKIDLSHQTHLETRLLEDAAIDSLTLIDLAEEVQRELNLVFQPDDYSFENLRSIRSILELVNRKRPAAGPPPA